MSQLSIVTPSLNQGRFIERTIRSVLEQGLATEYVVVDGGSTDETLDVLRRCETRLRWVSKPDQGQADAVNKGIRLTSGEVIGWLNSDDVYSPGALQIVSAFLDAHPEVDVVYGDAELIGEDDRVFGRYYTEPWRPERLRDVDFLCQPAVFFRRRVVERHGPLDASLAYCMDYEYWLRLSFGGATFAYLPRMLAGWRQHPETKTLAQRAEVHAEINTVLRRYFGRVSDRWLLTHAHTTVELRDPGRPRHMLGYRLVVGREALRLAWEWNGAISPSLVATVVRMLATGALKSGWEATWPWLAGACAGGPR